MSSNENETKTESQTEAQTDIQDRIAIGAVVQTFFAAFVSDDSAPDRWERLRALFLPGAVIVRTCGLAPAVYDVEGFIAPRRALLEGGGLTEFREWVLEGRLDVFGDIAQWYGTYEKAGRQDGRPVSGRGTKSIQLVRTGEGPGGWQISAAAWDDERPGVPLTRPADLD